MVQAFVLVKTGIGKVMEVFNRLKELDGVKKVNIVTGQFDLVVVAEAEHMATLMNVVIGEIRGLEGVADTNTSIVIE